eukprot:1142260-Pelagomonas_calceolata.AAC.15
MQDSNPTDQVPTSASSIASNAWAAAVRQPTNARPKTSTSFTPSKSSASFTHSRQSPSISCALVPTPEPLSWLLASCSR